MGDIISKILVFIIYDTLQQRKEQFHFKILQRIDGGLLCDVPYLLAIPYME
jgi:hypothetical protein